MLCRVDPLVVVLKSRCMRKDHSRRVPQEEAARRQEQLSSRHLLQAGGQGCVRRFQISPDHGFHRKSDSLASRDKAGVVTALVTGRRTELRRFQISPDHGFYRRGDSSSSSKKKIPESRAPLRRRREEEEVFFTNRQLERQEQHPFGLRRHRPASDAEREPPPLRAAPLCRVLCP